MTIETQFKVGEKVYFMCNNQIAQGTVEIVVATSTVLGSFICYYIKHLSDSELLVKKEKELYPSKQLLRDSL